MELQVIIFNTTRHVMRFKKTVPTKGIKSSTVKNFVIFVMSVTKINVTNQSAAFFADVVSLAGAKAKKEKPFGLSLLDFFFF